jgi:hypothetical protein
MSQAAFPTLKGSQVALSQYLGALQPHPLPDLSLSQVLTRVLEPGLGPLEELEAESEARSQR